MEQVGLSFQTADGNLSLEEFGELVCEVWSAAFPSIPMYQVGTSTDDVVYPNVTWRCFSKRPQTAQKPRTVDEFTGDDDKGYTRKTMRLSDIFEVVITANDPKQANQLIVSFERFMQQYAGAFKRAGIVEILYSARLPDTFKEVSGAIISYRTVHYEVLEELVTLEQTGTIDEIDVFVRAIKEEAPVLVTMAVKAKIK